jgi:hypothetical protein
VEVSCPFTYFFASITTTGDPFNLLSTHPRLTTDLLEVPKIPVGQYLYLYRDRNHKVTQPFLEVIHESDDLRPAWRSMVERSRVSREGTGGNKTVEAPSARVRVIDLLLSLMKSIKGKGSLVAQNAAPLSRAARRPPIHNLYVTLWWIGKDFLREVRVTSKKIRNVTSRCKFLFL